MNPDKRISGYDLMNDFDYFSYILFQSGKRLALFIRL